MSKLINLTHRKYAIVDDEDFDILSKYRWHISDNGYAKRSVGQRGSQRFIRMHRVINNTPKGMITDHINGDKLDNRKANLRNSTKQQNSANSKVHNTNKSGFRGVCFYKRDKNWKASIGFNGKSIHLGYFKTPEQASDAYVAKAKELFGEFVRVNYES